MAKNFSHLLFDYDNTLGLTEVPAFTACCGVVNSVLTSKGVNVQFTTESLMARFVGYSFRKMINELAVEHKFAIADAELEQLVLDEENAVIAKLAVDIQPTKGAVSLLQRLVGKFNLSVVSSSALRRVKACLKGAGEESFFGEQVFSAATYKSSKPDPRVYIEALKALGITADQALAIEDSRTGALAAVAAGITVIGYTGAYPEHERDHLTQVLLAAGCVTVIHDWADFDKALAIASA